MSTQSIWKNEFGCLEHFEKPTNYPEKVIELIYSKCCNIDDLKKINTAIECMIEEISLTYKKPDIQLPTLVQLLIQADQKLV